jgi:hypothetical protein
MRGAPDIDIHTAKTQKENGPGASAAGTASPDPHQYSKLCTFFTPKIGVPQRKRGQSRQAGLTAL